MKHRVGSRSSCTSNINLLFSEECSLSQVSHVRSTNLQAILSSRPDMSGINRFLSFFPFFPFFSFLSLYPFYFNLPFHQTCMDFSEVQTWLEMCSVHISFFPALPPKKITKFNFVPRLTTITDEKKVNLNVFKVYYSQP